MQWSVSEGVASRIRVMMIEMERNGNIQLIFISLIVPPGLGNEIWRVRERRLKKNAF